MINQQLIDFIKTQTQQGLDKEAISLQLTGNGWKMKDIEDAFDSLSTTSSNPIPVHPVAATPTHSEISIYTVVGISIIAICIFGAYNLIKNTFTLVQPTTVTSYKPAPAFPTIPFKANCGSAAYASPKDESAAMAASSCFNAQFKVCSPAVQVGFYRDMVSTHEIVGTKEGRCNVTYTTVVSNSGQPPVVWSCLFDPSQPIPTSFEEQQKNCTVNQ